MPDFFALFIGLILVAVPAYVLGWASGVGTLKNRQKKVTDALENYNKTVQAWSKSDDSVYWQGYASGVEATLKALYSFLATFDGERKKNGSS